MGTVLSKDSSLEDKSQDQPVEETAAYQHLVDCLSLDTWGKDCARKILVGCVPENIIQTNGRPVLLPGDSPLKGNPSDAGFYGHLRMELDRVSFVETTDRDLSPFGWIELAEKNRYHAPWMPIVEKYTELQRLLLSGRNAFKPILPAIVASNLKRDAALKLHEVTSQQHAKRLLLLSWDQLESYDKANTNQFSKWAKRTFVPHIGAMVSISTLDNWLSNLRVSLEDHSIPAPWLAKLRKMGPPPIPNDFDFPACSRGCSGEDDNG